MMFKSRNLLYKLKLARFGVLIFALLALLLPKHVSAAYDGANLIDNSIFLNSSSMSIANIQSFLESKGSGLASRSFLLNCYATNSKERQWYTAAGAPCDQTVPASQIIYYASQIYGINPQTVLATLQKEQSLVTSPNPTDWQINQAMGYGCPTTGGCGASNFFYQIDSGVWVLRYHYERANGNNTWWNTSSSWVCGSEKNFYKPNLYPFQDVRFYDEDGVQYRTHRLGSAATSSLYCYTPHAYNNPNGLYGLPVYGTTGRYYSGSYNFVYWFEQWFGSTIGAAYYACRNSTDVPGVPTGAKVIPNRFVTEQPETLTLSFLNNTGTRCIELHTWAASYQNWVTNVATNHPAFNPADGEVISANTVGDSKSELMFIKYRNTGSGRIEVHTWAPGYQAWTSNIATNYPAVDPTDVRVIAGDVNGDGLDELMFIKYRNTGSGRIEVHTWAPGYQAWTSNIATTSPSSEADNGAVIAGNVFSEQKDRLMFVKYTDTGSGRIEVHTWAPGYQAWTSNVATNYPSTDRAVGEVLNANVYGEARDRLLYIKYTDTGSGRIEVHTWAPGYQAWTSNVATNHPAL